MEFKKFEGLVYDVEKEVIGVLALTNNLTGEVVIATDDGEVKSHLDNLMKLEKIISIGDAKIVDGDVFSKPSDAEENLWEISLLNDDKVVLHLLDKGLNRVETGTPFDKSELVKLIPTFLTLEGHILELDVPEEKVVDFNIKIVKSVENSKVEYMYACNNKVAEQVDLISVVFVGSELLEEEDYKRLTMSHEEYLEFVERGYLVESTPQELQNYVIKLMSGQVATQSEERICGVNCGCSVYCEEDMYDEEDEYEDEDFEDEEDCDCDFCKTLKYEDDDFEDTCYDCGEYHEDCDC